MSAMIIAAKQHDLRNARNTKHLHSKLLFSTLRSNAIINTGLQWEWEETVPSARIGPCRASHCPHPSELHHDSDPALKRAGAMSGLTLFTSLPDQANFREEKE